jgi:hypothetical protein
MRAPIAALSSPPGPSIRIAQPPHQLRPRPRSPLNPPACLLGLPGKSVPRKSRDNKMERISRGGVGIHEPADDMSELQDRTGPAMGDEQGHGVLVL